MLSILSKNDWADLDCAVQAIAASGNAEVHEDGKWLAELAGARSELRCELRHEGKNSLIHFWSGERSLTRRILCLREKSGDRIVLDVYRFGRAKPSRLEFLRADSGRAPGKITREQFCARLNQILQERFPDAVIESLTAAPDLEHSFSGLYVRGSMRDGLRRGTNGSAERWALLAASPHESQSVIEKILAFGIVWLDSLRHRVEGDVIQGLRLFVPEGTSRSVRERSLALSASARTEIFEIARSDSRIQKMDVSDSGNLESWLITRRETESALIAAQEAFARVSSLARAIQKFPEEIRARALPSASEVALCYRGLEFARWTADGIFFGLGHSRERLISSREPHLGRLLDRLSLFRSNLATDKTQSLYRTAPERWMETLLLEDPSRLDAQLDPRHLYSQVPALAGGDRGVLDLLGVTRRGRLVVVELKASEDIQLPIQAVDYWLRACRHQRAGDFQGSGYFAGVEIDPRPPLVWLVAPALRFHSTAEILLKYLSHEIQFTRIGLNENWRRGVKIVFRK
jgi:hypothetical protein